MTTVTHYDTLKVARDAPQDVIRAVYKALAQKYHPDRNLDNPEAVQLMQLINVSYTVLSDPQKRAEYDRTLGKPVPPPTLQQQEQAKPANKANDEAAAWSAYAAKEAKEAAEAKEKAAKAMAQAQAAPAHEKAKWNAFVDAAMADAKAAEEKARKSAAQAQAAREKAGIKEMPAATAKTGISHYATLKILDGAPPEVVKAAYKALAQSYQAAEASGDAAAAAAMQGATQSYKILTDPQKRAEYDASIRPKDAPAAQQARKILVRTPTAREQGAQANADKANAQAAAFAALAERAAEEEREAKAKAEKAAKDAKDKAKDKDAEKWSAWAAKLAAEAKAATDRAAKAAADASNAKYKAAMAQKEKDMATRIADDDFAKAEKERALWAQTEKQG